MLEGICLPKENEDGYWVKIAGYQLSFFGEANQGEPCLHPNPNKSAWIFVQETDAVCAKMPFTLQFVTCNDKHIAIPVIPKGTTLTLPSDDLLADMAKQYEQANLPLDDLAMALQELIEEIEVGGHYR